MMRTPFLKKPLFIFLLSLVSFGLAAAPSSAQDEGAEGLTLNVVAGFDGFYKAEYVVPVQITVANSGPAVDGTLQIIIDSSSGAGEIAYEAPVELPTQSNKRLTLYVNISSFVKNLEVALLDDDGRPLVVAASNDMSQLQLDDLLYGVISPEPGEFSVLESVRGGRARAAAAFLELSHLPAVPAAWNALDLLVLNDTDSGELTAEQRSALTGWVSTGGLLVVTGGPGWQKTTAPLADMLPVTVTGSESRADLPALSQRVAVPFRDPGPYLVTTSTLNQGELLFHEQGLPLLARQDMGRGSVYFLALDPRLAPLLDWDGGELVWAEVANRVPLRPSWERGIQNGYAAATAVSSLPSLALPSVLQLILFLLFYILMIGPINYFVLRRYKRRELAWATVPALVLFFSGMAYLTGFQLKGNDIVINQMSYVYGHAGSEEARVQTLVGLYSPRRARYDLTLPSTVTARPFARDFVGLGDSSSVEAVTRSADLTLRGIRVDVSDIETFVVDSYQPALPIDGQVSLNMDGSDIQLNVQVQNNSQLALENATLLFGLDIFSLGNLGPGQSRSQSHVIGTTATTGTPPILSPPGYSAGIPSGSPLMEHADLILGTSDYYNDREAFPRWQMLQAFETQYAPRAAGTSPPLFAADTATLIAWSEQPQLEARLSVPEYTTFHTTLHFIQLPVTQNLVSGSDVSIPLPLLTWQVLAENGIYQPTVKNLYLQGAWVEFEYVAWPQFQGMEVKRLAISLQPINTTSLASLPDVRLWNWQDDVWDVQEDVSWGINPVADRDSYLGPNNAVRIRLQDNSNFGSQIGEVYPVLTGDLN